VVLGDKPLGVVLMEPHSRCASRCTF